jgi:hypothetical protein
MRGVICGLAVSCALGCGGSSEAAEEPAVVTVANGDEAPSRAVPVETPTSVRELGPSVDDGEAVAAWIAERAGRDAGFRPYPARVSGRRLGLPVPAELRRRLPERARRR